ncbi:potassium transporter TrkA [Halonotius terrestris]|uniref:Potassium transporter TrkA n=1 Tax=Halonotius terrestris TaxID=2487750 RepID=A0A8J8TB65_9EURY|nr:potassium transporter TrkA [Halonotius terrestris]TQQ79775.1 potassium transporter TrkA [Halonotius terrestris]
MTANGDTLREAFTAGPPSPVTFEEPTAALINLVVYAVLSVVATGGLAVAYRWYFKQTVPEGVSGFIGVSVVALYINTTSLGVAVSNVSVDLFEPGVVFFNVVALSVAAVAAPVGRRLGDAVSSNLFSLAGLREFEGEVGTVVRSAGRVTTITLPDEIADMESYDPVTDETKAELAGKTLLFPRRLTVDELRSRLIERLKEDHAVGYVDVDVTANGTVEFLAVGSRAAGIGATIAPGSVAVAIRADPPNNASPGDTVQVWTTEETPERLTTGELRGVAGDTVTLAIDDDDAKLLSPTEEYRLLTMPAEPQADREFATLLRSVDETMGTVTIDAGSELVGLTPRALNATVVAIRPDGEKLMALPDRDRGFEAGETIYGLGRPDVLRGLEERAKAGGAEDAESETDEPAAS